MIHDGGKLKVPVDQRDVKDCAEEHMVCILFRTPQSGTGTSRWADATLTCQGVRLVSPSAGDF